MNESLDRLPRELADYFTRPFGRFLRIEAAAGGLLLLSAIAALTLANSPWSSAFLTFWEMPIGLRFGPLEFSRSLQEWINDGLMTLFFFVVALELKRELVLGELRDLGMATLSFSAALGGMVVPAAFYLALQHGEAGFHGWGAVMATDTAFVIGCLAVLGSRIPQSLRVFLLSLAIFDDVGAILVVAFGYGDDIDWLPIAIAALGFLAVLALGQLGIRRLFTYFVVGGLIWLAVDASGIHPTVTGVLLGLMTPTGGWVSDRRLRAILDRLSARPQGADWSADTGDRRALRLARVATREAESPVEQLEMLLHPWVAFAIMPLFALANAGIAFPSGDVGGGVALAVFVGLVLGKPAGVIAASWLATRAGLARLPPGLSWPILMAGALLTGIGFTMALFIAGLAFSDALIDAAKLGILAASLASGAFGLTALAWVTSGSKKRSSAIDGGHVVELPR